ncbi:membrane protein insertion efficiency factor YidD [Candidatus Venteria ishoeyi]|nr:membrane protein insertion efficiency factor YidD [Candidatus Venteria ishoeyi]MDM8548066.1 membrane protein insertion efficiency factor YidD [Candidatus Venteria ishoeyi]
MKKLFILLIKFYSYIISPFLGNNCRYHPSCSSYMQEAIEKYGIWKGLGMGLKRLGRCHPWHEGGYDPVPEPPETDKPTKKQHLCKTSGHD